MNQQTSLSRQVTINVPGMSCGSCVRHIGKALAEYPGLQDVVINLPSRTLQVTFDPAQIAVETIVHAIRRSGYPAELPEE